MKLLRPCLIILTAFTFNFSKAVQNSHLYSASSPQDSIYRIWKFKKIEIPKNHASGMSAFYMDKYDTWDLTKKGIVSYSVADSPGVFHEIPYKLIDNAIVLQFPENKADFGVRYKIKELTSTTLKVIMHITDSENGKIKEFDVIELDFEAK